MIVRQLLLLFLITTLFGDCAFRVDDDLVPYIPKGDEVKPSLISISSCTEDWTDKPHEGCCNVNSYRQTQVSFLKIDTVFGSSASGGSGGCDLCAINLKRFWCQYACDPNQANFLKIGIWKNVSSFNHPGELVWVQEVFLTVESTTACRLFQSCQRTSYAAQLSALQSPAGFLNFQGTNAIEDARQIIYVDFTDDKTKGLYMQTIDDCGTQLLPPSQLHRGFKVVNNCSCNSCESKCNGTSYYQPTPIMQGFNSVAVGAVWGGVIGAIILITGYRIYREKRKQD